MPKQSNARGLLRAFVETFAPLKLALRLNDLVCCLFARLVDLLGWAFRNWARLVLFAGRHLLRPVRWLVAGACSQLARLLGLIPAWRRLQEERQRAKYRRLDELQARLHREPVPYEGESGEPSARRELLIKRSITYHGGMLLALLMYVFVYFVLVKRHSYATVSVGLVLLLVYLLLVENSHNLRSILMLCLPIMFTNRGRALVFCSMLALLANGPIRTTQENVREIHSSLNCCKQYLVVRTDKYVGESVISKLVRVEEVVLSLVRQIKRFAGRLKRQFDRIVELALEAEQFIVVRIRRLKEILNICNKHTNQLHRNCVAKFNSLNADCRLLFGPFVGGYCTLFGKLDEICDAVKLPQVLCRLPQQVVDFYERTIGRKLAEYVHLIESEFYVDVDVSRSFAYNLTKSKSYSKVGREIKFDVAQKFWYVHLVRRVFNLISLILVVWILTTATVYHMHYLSELDYDNMYLDERLHEIEQLRRAGPGGLPEREARSLDSQETVRSSDLNNNQLASPDLGRRQQLDDEDELVLEAVHALDDDDEQEEREEQTREPDEARPAAREDQSSSLGSSSRLTSAQSFVFPLKRAHERHYLKPFSVYMNNFETSKLYWSSLVWLAIVGYILFFLLLDFALYHLVDFLVDTLRSILFTSELPLIDLETRTRTAGNSIGDAGQVVRYNRTYLRSLRRQRLERWHLHQLNRTRAAPEPGDQQAGELRTTNGTADGELDDAQLANSTIQAFYDRLVESLERDIPDDVAILESLEGCLPSAQVPAFGVYRTLGLLALFTFCAVIVEAYALRTRHCIANLYYPKRARQRAFWLYRKLLKEKAKYEDYAESEPSGSQEDRRRRRQQVAGLARELLVK